MSAPPPKKERQYFMNVTAFNVGIDGKIQKHIPSILLPQKLSLMIMCEKSVATEKMITYKLPQIPYGGGRGGRGYDAV